MRYTPCLLIINDGWGVAPASRANAITEANTPVFDHLIKHYWVETLQASGEAVGLPWGEAGNSEVGHLSLGSGRIIFQDLPRITRAISDGSFLKNKVFIEAMSRVTQSQNILHLAGLLSEGGVHSYIEHMYALVELSVSLGVPRVALHCFLDGRDVPYNSAMRYVAELEERIHAYEGRVRIATIAGRYWAMDRDNRWDRIAESYEAICLGSSSKTFPTASQAIKFYYDQEMYDEQIPPTVIAPRQAVASGDSIIFFNFRADRMRQLTSVFALKDFTHFKRREDLEDLYLVTMTEYDKSLPIKVAFPTELITMPLSKALSEHGIRQLHIAETEKYAHVTYFFNGGREEAFPGEDRMLIPSPQVENYAQSPEMSAIEIGNRLVQEIEKDTYGFLLVNLANADMVGHTGDLKATLSAIETLDRIFKLLTEAMLSKSGIVFITADHGNAEGLFDPQSGEINKEHSANPVPFVIVGRDFIQEKQTVPDLSTRVPRGVLADVAPTVLHVLGISIPPEMTGRSLI